MWSVTVDLWLGNATAAEAEGVPEAKQRELAAMGSAMGLSLG